MQLARPMFALDPRHFGRAPLRLLPDRSSRPSIGADLKLFATTFVAGFLFISVLIA